MAYDATVMDWVWQGNKAMSEKEATIGENPKYRPEWQGIRQENGGPFGLNQKLERSPGHG